MFKYSQLVTKGNPHLQLINHLIKSNQKIIEMISNGLKKFQKSNKSTKMNRKIKSSNIMTNSPVRQAVSTRRGVVTTASINVDDKQTYAKNRRWILPDVRSQLKSTSCHKDVGLEFVLMSYNILAQNLLELHPYLYEYHNRNALNWEYRLSKLAQEINTLKPHILCLQEVQKDHLPAIANRLKKLNFDYVFKKKTGIRSDGCAIFYNKNLFSLIERYGVEYYQPRIEHLDRENIALIAKLCLISNPKTCFIVATTHLLYNPRRQDVRLAQIQVLLAELDRISVMGFYKDSQPKRMPIILTGDFNLQPNSAPYELITKGDLYYSHLTRHTLEVPAAEHSRLIGNVFLPPRIGITDNCQHFDIVHNKYQGFSRLHNTEIESKKRKSSDHKQINDQMTINDNVVNDYLLSTYPNFFSSGRLNHSLNLSSVYRHIAANGQQEASTFQNKWITVDYIFYSKYFSPKINSICEGYLKLKSYYSLPSVDQCHAMGMIPNSNLGSDHLALAATFYLQTPKKH